MIGFFELGIDLWFVVQNGNYPGIFFWDLIYYSHDSLAGYYPIFLRYLGVFPFVQGDVIVGFWKIIVYYFRRPKNIDPVERSRIIRIYNTGGILKIGKQIS